jgi:peptidoglycan/LPS O-acetylase OafA/YrhL
MQFYSAWPFFVCVALLLALANTPAFAAADTPPSAAPNRIKAMDGLRGFLALGVVFAHVALYHSYLLTGIWDQGPTRFYIALGSAGVGMFFMITGYLFWGKLLRDRGRPAWLQLYIGRIFRIGPLYVAAAVGMLVIVAFVTHFHLNVSPQALIGQVGAWLALGFVDGPDVNNFPLTTVLLAGVTWSLVYEWRFYLALLLLAPAARLKTKHQLFVAIALSACLIHMVLHPYVSFLFRACALFLAGMLCASLKENGLLARLPNRLGSLAALVLLAASFVFSNSVTQVLCLGLVFYLIASGCTIFGLLVSRPARRLGDISYGIYLLQGFPLAALFRFKPLQGALLTSPLYHWGAGLLAAALLIALATAAHVWIERPGIKLGKRLSTFVERSVPIGAKPQRAT